MDIRTNTYRKFLAALPIQVISVVIRIFPAISSIALWSLFPLTVHSFQAFRPVLKTNVNISPTRKKHNIFTLSSLSNTNIINISLILRWNTRNFVYFKLYQHLPFNNFFITLSMFNSSVSLSAIWYNCGARNIAK